MSAHLLNKPTLGTYAVFGFYIISGYLMTLIMHKNYGYTLGGRVKFIANRILRLYPLYWIAASFSILLIIWIGAEQVKSYHESIFMPTLWSSILSNISILFLDFFPNNVNPRLSPPTWALTVEIFFYVLICLGLSKNITRVYSWLIVSVIYFMGTYAMNLGWEYRYFPITAASLPFAAGSLIYFLTEEKRYVKIIHYLPPFALLLLLLANSLLCFLYEMYYGIGFYINLSISILLVYSLGMGNKWKCISRSLDKLIGDLSYPIYLLHWQSGLFISYLIFSKPFHDNSLDGYISLTISILVTIIMSLVLIKCIDHPIQSIRKHIKGERHLEIQTAR